LLIFMKKSRLARDKSGSILAKNICYCLDFISVSTAGSISRPPQNRCSSSRRIGGGFLLRDTATAGTTIIEPENIHDPIQFARPRLGLRDGRACLFQHRKALAGITRPRRFQLSPFLVVR
jgi:hypothetical protein